MVSQNNNQNNGKVEYDGRTYQTVAYRLAEFRKQFPAGAGWDIATECLQNDAEQVIFKATIKTPDGKAVACGHAHERWNSPNPINQTNAYENAETSAIGRALAAAGFIGSEFASADELAAAIQARQSNQASKATAKPQPKAGEAPAAMQANQAALPAQAKPAQAAQPKPTSPAAEKSQAKQAEQGQANSQPSEETAEKWAREHLADWLDQPCQFAKAQGRTWRQLGENLGERINLKGKPCLPRAYLHALENWDACKVWQRMQARVVLAVIESKNGKHGPLAEVGR
jgi:hypothetical protein